jgi:Fe-S-cluster containining protein
MKQKSKHSIQLDAAKVRELFHSGTRKEFVAGVRLALRQILAKLHVESHYNQVINLTKQDSCYRELNNTWEELKPEVRSQKWQELLERLVQIAYGTRPYCFRCGDCCHLGSPSLHPEDAELLSRGVLSTRQIYTLRRGEPAKFNIDGRIGALPSELIKIKQHQEKHHCIFYEKNQRGCTIYDHRPLQCRVQACWAPEGLEKLWQQAKLTRRHLFKEDQDLLEMLEVHDERCDPRKLDAAFTRLHDTGDLAVLDEVLDLLRQDTAIRAFVIKKLNREDEELDFLLGRPLVEIVRAYGMKVEKDENGVYHLVSDG